MGPRHFRQGDVLLLEVKGIPLAAETIPRRGPCVLAHGERTGHTHAFQEADAQLVRTADDELFVLLPSGGTLRHQEHASIDVPAGKWAVIRQREFSPREPGDSRRADLLGLVADFRHVED